MRTYGENWLRGSVAAKLIRNSLRGEFNGLMDSFARFYLDSCTAFHATSGSLIIFTRDSGHHTSGWFKNPDYERCLHLSLSYREPFSVHVPRPSDKKLCADWAELFFADARRLAWIESPKTEEGQALDVLHYRVFTNPFWQPIHPRGEVYTRDFTEKDWKSFSELHPDEPEPSIIHAG